MFSNLISTGLLIFGILLGVLFTLLIWNKPVFVIYFQIIYCFFFRLLLSQFGFPGFIKYLFDYFTIILFIQVVLYFNKTKFINIRKQLFFIFLFFLIATISTIYNSSSLISFLFGVRINIRFYIFFVACIIFLKIKDIDKIIKYFFYIFPINLFFILIQYIQGYRFDFLSGLFGIYVTGNTELVNYLIIMIIITTIYYVKNKINILLFITYLGITALISAMSELKIIYPIILFVLFFTFIKFPNARAIRVTIIASILSIFSYFLLLIIYPHWADSIRDLDNFINVTLFDDYDHPGGLNRLTAGPFLLKNVLIETPQKLLGMGFGTINSFLIFSSSFMNRYEILNFDNFRYTLVLAESGIFGLITYTLFFLTITYDSLRLINKSNNEHITYYYISFLVSLSILLIIVYGASMFMDGAFVVFFCLTFPFIIEKEKNENNIILKVIH